MLAPRLVFEDLRSTYAVVDPARLKDWGDPENAIRDLDDAGTAFRLDAALLVYYKYNRPTLLAKYVSCEKFRKRLESLKE